MTRNHQLTYGQLIQQLERLGYRHQNITWNDGTKKWKFQHNGSENATIILPQEQLDERVDPRHLGTVRAILTAHGLIEDDRANFLENFGNAHPATTASKSSI